jgi:hypothetical protein
VCSVEARDATKGRPIMKVKVRGRINAPADAVFKEVSDFGFLDRLDLIESCTVEGNGVGAVRTATFTDHKLGRVVERLEAYDAKARSLSYSIINDDCVLPVENYLATVRVVEDGRDRCILEWGSVFDLKGMAEHEARPMFEGFYREAVDVTRRCVADRSHDATRFEKRGGAV